MVKCSNLFDNSKIYQMKKIAFLLLWIVSFKAEAQTFTLKSNELGGQFETAQLFNSFGCSGENKSPQLYWINPPKETKSFAVTMFDEDAPTGSGWWHWIIFDIEKNISELKTNAGNTKDSIAPKNSMQSITDFGFNGYGGPCPPSGDKAHKYIITVYALKIEKLSLPNTANPALVGFYLNQNAIEKASLIIYAKR